MKIDMHVHTSGGSVDGIISGAEMARLYKAAGYGAIVITEHLHERYPKEMNMADRVDKWLSGYREAREEGEKIGLKVFLGAEARVEKYGHEDFLIYGLEEENVEWLMRTLDSCATVEELSNAVRINGFFFAQAHPYRGENRVQDAELLDGIEAFNGKPNGPNNNNHRAFDYAVEHDLVMIAGSDTHIAEDIAHGGLDIPADIDTSRALFNWLRAGSLRSRVNFNRRVICSLSA